jgi:LysM repeat protein
VGQKLIIPSKQVASKAEAPAPAAPAKAADASGAAAADSLRYTVKTGDTLGVIARHYRLKQGDIAVANNITDPRKIQPGQVLIIPNKGESASSKSAASATSPRSAPAADEDLDAGLKPSSATDVPVVKIDDSSAAAQPKNP